MVGADPGRRLCLCELVCLHKHTYMHAYTHSFVKLFCFHISLGDFPQTELFPCMHTLPDMKTELKNFHLQVMLIIKNTKGKKNPKPLPFYHCQNWTPTPSNHTTETHKSTQQISPFCPAFRPLCSFPHSVSDTNSDVWQKRDTADCPPAASCAAKWEMQAWKQARDSSQDSKARSIAEVTELSVVGRGWRGHSAATQHCLPYRHNSILRGYWGTTAVFFFPIFPFALSPAPLATGNFFVNVLHLIFSISHGKAAAINSQRSSAHPALSSPLWTPTAPKRKVYLPEKRQESSC